MQLYREVAADVDAKLKGIGKEKGPLLKAQSGEVKAT